MPFHPSNPVPPLRPYLAGAQTSLVSNGLRTMGLQPGIHLGAGSSAFLKARALVDVVATAEPELQVYGVLTAAHDVDTDGILGALSSARGFAGTVHSTASSLD